MKTLNGKNVLITGAGSGIGRLMAINAVNEKANVALIDVNAKALKETEDSLKSRNVTVKSYVCDISDNAKVVKVSKQIIKDFQTIDVLINNAGIVIGKKFLDLSLEDMERTMNINFWGHIYFTRQFLPGMMARGKGSVVNIASAGGLLGMVNMSDYCASKFAEVGFSETLRRELNADGYKDIKITCVCPYIIDTGMFKGFKPMLLNPVLQPEFVARKVIDAVKKEKPYVILPSFMVRLMLVMKLFPTRFFDWVLDVFGGSRAMKTFIGRH